MRSTRPRGSPGVIYRPSPSAPPSPAARSRTRRRTPTRTPTRTEGRTARRKEAAYRSAASVANEGFDGNSEPPDHGEHPIDFHASASLRTPDRLRADTDLARDTAPCQAHGCAPCIHG